ncbi:MAG: glutamate racemase [Pseudorhodoplanes sp.]|jgi:glutamate racemase|nr:glutamate racemase [Pseudorhodoplanes sp.]
MTSAPVILVFDSGLGGLTVYREVAAARPDAQFVYAADDAAFPYGRFGERELTERVLTVMARLIEQHAPTLIVIACNTASTLVLAELRKNFPVPFVGTVPAIKPACTASQTKLVSVLGTEGTVAREYTRTLIRDFAQGCEVTLVGSKNLAMLAEAHLRGELVGEAAIAGELAPCFVEKNGVRTDTVVLACTHYPLLLERLQVLAPWPVTFVDPAPAIARRVIDLIGPARGANSGTARHYFTSGRPPAGPLAAALAGFGLTEGVLAVPARFDTSRFSS